MNGQGDNAAKQRAVFVKQLGAKPVFAVDTAERRETHTLLLRDRKGGDWDEWPADLRIREYPRNETANARLVGAPPDPRTGLLGDNQ